MGSRTRRRDTVRGLTEAEAAERLAFHGPNAMPQEKTQSVFGLFVLQFANPLAYILLAAVLVSLLLGDLKDAGFIGIVLVINGIVGTLQEYSASRAAAALKRLEQPLATVIRDGRQMEIQAAAIVPGDAVLLSPGARVPADMQLQDADGLQVDESLLTGESLPVRKSAPPLGASDAEDRRFHAYAGSLVTRGRGAGIAVATGADTEIGQISRLVALPGEARAPLLVRMDRFARVIAACVGVAVLALVLAGAARGMGLEDLFMMSVGLAVSAIPEGLPVAISIALAIGMRRMAAANVIVRRMSAIEALGSCTVIASDKTGTLTQNELTVTEVLLPDATRIEFGSGPSLDACTVAAPGLDATQCRLRASALLTAAALPNEATLQIAPDGWAGAGDTVDVALLAAAHKAGIVAGRVAEENPLISRIPYEPDLRFAASFHGEKGNVRIFVKGAPETLIAMADRMEWNGKTRPADRAELQAQIEMLAGRGLRVLGFAAGQMTSEHRGAYGHRHLSGLVFLGLAGLQDPLRPEVPGAVLACANAGISVCMVTGDDPRTAATIARSAGLAFKDADIMTGDQLARLEAEGTQALDRATRHVRIYARVEPAQKLSIVRSLARNGHFVAVTGDGVNDAPALRHAHVGVAMGRKGTDVAKASADIIITDDNFASIVAGIREGRVAYANIRKVVFMLVSTGAAEVLLFLLALPLGLPMPLLPVQLLWLNLVTNGIQDVALAAEPAEGDELQQPARRPSEPIFDAIMVRRIILSTTVMGAGGFAVFWVLLSQGVAVEQARNLLLLLFVLFENFLTLSSRSERFPLSSMRLTSNPLLLGGILAAQSLHISAMHIPLLRETLALSPVSALDWAVLLAIASLVAVVVEADKLLISALRRRQPAEVRETSQDRHSHRI
jgi:P-type Ca2+ transporter type 2C